MALWRCAGAVRGAATGRNAIGVVDAPTKLVASFVSLSLGPLSLSTQVGAAHIANMGRAMTFWRYQKPTKTHHFSGSHYFNESMRNAKNTNLPKVPTFKTEHIP